MRVVVELTDEQYAGLTFVTNQSNLTSEEQETPEQYAQRTFSGACDSYVNQIKVNQHAKLAEGLDMLTPEQLNTVLKNVPPEVLDAIGVAVPN